MIDKFVHAAIVNPDELAALKSATEQAGLNLIYLDGTFVLPTSPEDIHKNHEDKRLPGALFFDIKSVADKNSSLPHMLPDADAFADAISALGIQNNDVIVVYGQHGMIMGPARVWWMFKGFGHENIIVLNGGLPAYEQADLELESGPHKTQPASVYNAKPFNTNMVVNMQDVLTTLEDCACPIVDARPANRYSGESPEPREGMRSGHMPGSLNTPASDLVDTNGMLKSKEDLTAMMQKCGLIQNQQGTQRIITTCGSGITACALSLALYHLGQHNVAVYDGSWSEWGLESSPTPVKQASQRHIMQETDKHVTYNGIDAHIKIPARPQGLAFIAPGALVGTQSSLITTAQSAFEDLGYATVVADIGPSELNMDDPVNVHGNFSKNLQGVIDGYFEDEENDYIPNRFELAGHSMGGAAVLTIASENPVSAITVFDPTPVQEDVLSQVNAPVTIMVSQVRSFKASGHRALERLGGEERGHSIHELNTSTERHSGHMFEGAEHEITHIIQNRPQGGTSPNPSTPDTLDL